jgi:hypothetical protein
MQNAEFFALQGGLGGRIICRLQTKVHQFKGHPGWADIQNLPSSVIRYTQKFVADFKTGVLPPVSQGRKDALIFNFVALIFVVVSLVIHP